MTFNLNPGEVMAIIVATVTIVTGMWHAAMHIGKLTVRMERVESKVADIEGLVERRHEHR